MIRGAALALCTLLLAAPGRLAVAAPETDKPVREYRTVLEKNPGDRDVRHRLAARLTELNRLPEARAEYETLRKGDANDPTAAYGLGVVLLRQQDWAALDAALGGVPATLQTAKSEEYAKLWHNLGVARERESAVPGARAAYTKALELVPARDATRIALAAVELTAGEIAAAESQLVQVKGAVNDEQKRVLTELQAALAAKKLEAGDLAAAESWLGRARGNGVEPVPFALRFNTALLALKKNDLAGARTGVTEILDSPIPDTYKPAVAVLLYNLALAARNARDYAAAEADLKRALELVPDDAPSLLMLATLQLASDRHAEAAINARKCIEADPEQDECRIAYADAYVRAKRELGMRGEEAARRGNIPGAIEALQQALSVDPEDAVLEERIAVLKVEETELAKVRTAVDKSLDERKWDDAMTGILELYRRAPADPTLPAKESELQAGIVSDRLALVRRAEDAVSKGQLYRAAESWKQVVALDANDEESGAKATAAEESWKKQLAADREEAKKLSAARKHAEARLLLVKWTEQGLKDDALKRQLEALDRVVLAQTATMKQNAEQKVKAKDWEGAKKEYEVAARANPSDKAATAGVERASAHLDATRGAAMGRQLYSEGVVLYSRGSYEEAIAKWNEVLELPGAGEWATRAKSHIERAKNVLKLAEVARKP